MDSTYVCTVRSEILAVLHTYVEYVLRTVCNLRTAHRKWISKHCGVDEHQIRVIIDLPRFEWIDSAGGGLKFCALTYEV